MKFRLTEDEDTDKKPKPAVTSLHAEHIAAIAGVVLVLLTAAGFGWWIFMSSPGHEPQGESEAESFNEDSTLIDPMLPQSSLSSAEAFTPSEPTPAPPPAQQPREQSPAPQAALAPAPALEPQSLPSPFAPDNAPLDRASSLRRFVSDFDGGDCFFALPLNVDASSATIEAFAGSISSAQALDRSFREANGFEAQIGVRPVAPAQCAAVAFARQFSRNQVAAPGISLDSFTVHAGQPLTGSVSPVLDGALAVLVVSESGEVTDFSNALSRGGGPERFSIDVSRGGYAGTGSFLFMVVASRGPLPSLSAHGPLPPASELFPRLAEEARQTAPELAIALSYGKIES